MENAVRRTAQKWVDLVKYDLDSARIMQETGKYLHALFFCQQAIEKAVKALIVDRTGDLPPRIHSLPKLMIEAELQPDEIRMNFLSELSLLYIQSRYPEDIELPETVTNRDKTKAIVEETEGIVEWLLSMLK